MKQYIIDRFEGDFAVCETCGEMINLPRSLLPENAAEGDVLIESDGSYIINADQTEKRRKKIRELKQNLWK